MNEIRNKSPADNEITDILFTIIHVTARSARKVPSLTSALKTMIYRN